MSIEKSEIKQLVCHDLGVKLDDLLEGANKAQVLHEGAKLALKQLAKSLQGLAEIADGEASSELIPDLETLKHIKRYITRAVNAAENLSRHYENQEIAAAGSANMAQKAVKVVQQMYTEEKAKADAAIASLSQPDSGRRLTGVRPGRSVAAKRKAEEKKKCQEPQTETQAQG